MLSWLHPPATCCLALTRMDLQTTLGQKSWTTTLLRLFPSLLPCAVPSTPETASSITDRDFRLQNLSKRVHCFFSLMIAFSPRTGCQRQMMVSSHVALLSGVIVGNGTYCMLLSGERNWMSKKKRLPKNENMWPMETWYCRFQVIYNLKEISNSSVHLICSKRALVIPHSSLLLCCGIFPLR